MNLETLYKEPRIYAFTLESRPGWIKVGYTDRQTVAERVKQETQVLNVRYKIEVDEKAQTDDGRMFDDNAVFKVLEEKMGILRDKRVDSSSGKKRVGGSTLSFAISFIAVTVNFIPVFVALS